MDLVFHIGLSKCASTTLQNEVFREAPGYLGTGAGIPRRYNFGKQFQHHCPIGGRTAFDLSAALNWRDRVLKFVSAKEGVNNCILSNEVLSTSTLNDPTPIVPVLKQFNEQVWVHGKVKVILVVRNQIDRLGSLYSQSSQARFNAGQADFERFVTDWLYGKKLGALYYADWVENLRKALGPENVLILLLEDIQKMEFWQSLGSFCGLQSLSPERMQANSGQRQNVSSTGLYEWKVRPLDVPRKARAVTKHALNRVLSKPRQEGKDHLLFTPLFPLAKVWYFVQARIRDRGRSDLISINARLMEAIVDHCAEDNRRLGALLDRDLSEIGYPMRSNAAS
jgi:hypothetical protein